MKTSRTKTQSFIRSLEKEFCGRKLCTFAFVVLAALAVVVVVAAEQIYLVRAYIH